MRIGLTESSSVALPPEDGKFPNLFKRGFDFVLKGGMGAKSASSKAMSPFNLES